MQKLPTSENIPQMSENDELERENEMLKTTLARHGLGEVPKKKKTPLPIWNQICKMLVV